MAQSKRMVNNQTSQHELLNPKKIFFPSRHFSMRQRNITIVTSYRSPCRTSTKYWARTSPGYQPSVTNKQTKAPYKDPNIEPIHISSIFYWPGRNRKIWSLAIIAWTKRHRHISLDQQTQMFS
jgi:hypothetical protein